MGAAQGKQKDVKASPFEISRSKTAQSPQKDKKLKFTTQLEVNSYLAGKALRFTATGGDTTRTPFCELAVSSKFQVKMGSFYVSELSFIFLKSTDRSLAFATMVLC